MVNDAPLSLDLFCRVVDNYGDIGVCWRLARQLSTEHAVSVRLIVDDLSVFHKLEPALNPDLLQQNIAGVTVLRWSDTTLDRHYGEPSDAVLEAFACNLPDIVIERMKTRKPVWIDFEYLTAETWIDDCHGRPSPHPGTGLTKTLFFPGFTAETGLIREAGLIEARTKFVADVDAQNTWRTRMGLPLKEGGITDVSLFCYADSPLDIISEVPSHIRLFVPDGVAPELTGPQIVRFPFLTSGDYDRLLWTCDVNFVRGEDSWVRAIWAGKPFIWQIYRQDDNAHLAKLRAFLDRYMNGLTLQSAETLADFHAMWNERGREGKTASRLWDSLLPLLPQLSDHALSWSGTQASSEDCATSLIRFIRTQNNKH